MYNSVAAIFKGLEAVLSDENAVPREYKSCIEKMINERVKYIEKIFD